MTNFQALMARIFAAIISIGSSLTMAILLLSMRLNLARMFGFAMLSITIMSAILGYSALHAYFYMTPAECSEPAHWRFIWIAMGEVFLAFTSSTLLVSFIYLGHKNGDIKNGPITDRGV